MSQAFLDRATPTAGAKPHRHRPALAARLARAGALSRRVPPGACRFLVVGGLSSALNWLVRFPLSLALPYGAAVAAAYMVGMVASFGLYRSWVFPGSGLSLSAQATRFVLVNLVGLTSVVAAAQGLALLLHGGGWLSPRLAEAGAHGLAIAAGALVNFLGHRALTFARGRPRIAGGDVAPVAASGSAR